MRIGSLLPGSSTPLRNKNVDLSKSSSFQQAMAAQLREGQDSIVISDTGKAATMQAEASQQISPGDSTLVKLAKLKSIAANTDFGGMSYPEIYTSLWRSYDNAFGGNLPSIMCSLANGQERMAIHDQFMSEYYQYFEKPLNNQIYRETGYVSGTPEYKEVVRLYLGDDYSGSITSVALGYGGMSFEEMETAIYEKYAGKNTLQDFLNMQGELWNTGVLVHKMGFDAATSYLGIVDRQLTQHFFPDDFMAGTNPTQAQWNSVYNTEFDVRGFYGEVKEAIKHMTFSNWSFDIQGALLDGADHMLAMLDKRDQARAAGK